MLGHFFALMGFAFIGPVVSPFAPFLATEAMAIFYGGELGVNPWLVGLSCAIGQNLCYIGLYFGGGQLVGRWQWLGRRIQWFRAKYSGARRGFLVATWFAMFFGVPPVLPLAIVARGFAMPLLTLLAIGFPLRLFRFTILAAIGSAIWPSVVALWDRLFG